ncbi:MAG: dTDP-4-dehydrorhamnose reductase [Firmicutes bacterium]|nr:dTDP-4-dehydrorhamnose reductase [Bacillota bacterium]
MLGRDLVEALSKENEVVGLDIRSPKPPVKSLRSHGAGKVQSPKSIKFVEADITNKEEIIKVIRDEKPEIVIHAAAYTDVDGCEKNEDLTYRVNSTGTQNVALACKECKAIIAYISTDFVFDGEKKEPYLESDKLNPLSVYGESKLAGERHISLLLDRYFIIRTSWLFGKHGRNFVNTILKLAQEKKELRVVNDQVGAPTYTKDLAHAISKLINLTHNSSLITHNLFGIYHISNSGSCSWYEFAQEILRVTSYKLRVTSVSSEELNRPARRPKFSVLDNSHYIKTVGKSLRPWQEALREYLQK